MSLLDLFEEYDVKVTFFVLGVICEWYPELLREILKREHEVAFHGYSHNKSRSRHLIDELSRSEKFIRKYKMDGFRAPEMSISKQDLDSLKSFDFKYDSSIYGSNHTILYNEIIEVPVSTYPVQLPQEKLLPKPFMNSIRHGSIPIGSGAFLGLLQSKTLDALIRKINKKKHPFIAFIHPWQFTNFPKKMIKFNDLYKLPYWITISKNKIKNLLSKHSFVSMKTILKEIRD